MPARILAGTEIRARKADEPPQREEYKPLDEVTREYIINTVGQSLFMPGETDRHVNKLYALQRAAFNMRAYAPPEQLVVAFRTFGTGLVTPRVGERPFSDDFQQEQYADIGAYVLSVLCRPALYDILKSTQLTQMHELMLVKTFDALAHAHEGEERAVYEAVSIDGLLIAPRVREGFLGIKARNS